MITLQKQPIFLLTGGVVSQASDSSLSKNSMVKQRHRIQKVDKLYSSPCQGRDVWTTSDWTTSKGDWYCCLSGVGQVDGKRRSQLSDAVTVFFIQTLRWYFHRDAVTVFFKETLRQHFHRDAVTVFFKETLRWYFHRDIQIKNMSMSSFGRVSTIEVLWCQQKGKYPLGSVSERQPNFLGQK